MESRPAPNQEPDIPTLLAGIARDAETLIGQQFELVRAELKQELSRAAGAAAELGGGAVLVATGGVLAAFMTVHALHRATRLPLWACYGLVAGAAGGAGAALLRAGQQRVAGLPLVPEQAAEALQENLAWAKDQVTNP